MIGRILVVDDDRSVLTTVVRMLERGGYDVDPVGGGREAQARLREQAYDVAIIDLRMPEFDGFAVLEWMQQEKIDAIPIVLSGTTLIEDAVKAVQRGAFDFVPKPIEEYDVFLQHISRAIEHKRLRENRDELLAELSEKNVELGNRLSQLEVAHRLLQTQAASIQADLNRAMRIQQALLPRSLPFPDLISLTPVYRPATKVGGDFYDLFELDEHRVGIYIADTSGHGVSSALLTMLLKHLVQPAEMVDGKRHVNSPAALLRDINTSVINESFGHDIFITMTSLVLDVKNGALTYANAGHPPFLVKHPDGTIDRYRSPAPALGINPQVKYTNSSLDLEKGDIVVLYTDGVTEACNAAGEYYGEGRLMEAVLEADGHAEQVAARVEADLVQFSRHRAFDDDVTLLVLGLEPQEGPFRVPSQQPAEAAGDEAADETPVMVRTATREDRMFISVSGAASWRESRRVQELCREARDQKLRFVIMDFTNCNHLDSTFLGVLHNLTKTLDTSETTHLEIQNVPGVLLREMSELGLTGVLMHFRPEPRPLPESMREVDTGEPDQKAMGELLLRAHEALVDADPRNADRFAAVLKVLHDQVHGKDQGQEQ